ncbi:SDR family NAD(P)-dependent oxidoreductase [Chloroflexota bacterium]
MLLADKVAIITGGSVGMGRAMALKFAEEGCLVTVADIAETEGEKTVAKVSETGREGLFVRCDVTDRSQIKEVVEKTISKFGKIDILVNNAGGIVWGKEDDSFEGEISEETWDRNINLNFKSFLYCTEAVAPYMKKQKSGNIINLSSLGGISPPAGGRGSRLIYHIAKGGVVSLTINLALDYVDYNIRVNVIAPGPIRSDFYSENLKGKSDAEADAFFNRMGKDAPMARVGMPEEVAGVALFLASDLSSYVTGQLIYCGGGIPLWPKRMRG